MVSLSKSTSLEGNLVILGQWELLTDTQWGRTACFLRYKGEFKYELFRNDLLDLMEKDYVFGYGGNTYLNSWDWWDLKGAMDFCLAVKGVKVSEVFSLLSLVWHKLGIFFNSESEIVPLLMLYNYQLRSWDCPPSHGGRRKYRYSVKEFAILATKIFGIPVSVKDVIECFKRNKIRYRKKGRDYQFSAHKHFFRDYQAYLCCLEKEKAVLT